MKPFFFQLIPIYLLFSLLVSAQAPIKYEISFENAIHHEAEIKVTFSDVRDEKFSFRMSRSSPGRYAIHEFAKNVYQVHATNANGKELKITRPNPYQWDVENHGGTVVVTYTLFANRGDGTYAQIDETHAHLNMPATFMYAPSQSEHPIEVAFIPRQDFNWKIATQLKKEKENIYSAPNMQYFMDSPTELSNHQVRSFTVTSNNKTYTINFALHHQGTEEELDEYFEKVKKIVLQEKAVYDELPDFDFGEYTFLACYMPNASGDGMEHRNSTVLTSSRSLENRGMEGNIGTVSHEFFHAWNVERIRPQSLEPFDFSEANMSGELWFAEGFTSYYTNLILCRAGLISEEEYISDLSGTFNYVWNSPGTLFFNPIEMSYQAPFVDAATSVDPVNRENTFISYYSYGSALGLALDLSLRAENRKLDLDGYMKLVWNKFGKNEKPYTVENLHQTLKEYAGHSFGDNFFNNYIYDSKMPNYLSLFESFGIALEQKIGNPSLGASVYGNSIVQNPKIDHAAYKAGLIKGDKIIAINNIALNENNELDFVLAKYQNDELVNITFERFGQLKNAKLKLEPETSYAISTFEKLNKIVSNNQAALRKDWLIGKN